MSDKDDIKDLFQRELGNYEAKVDPGLWQGVQAGLSGSAATGASAGLSIAAKVAIGVVSAAAITVASVVIYNATQESSNTSVNHQKELVSSQIVQEDVKKNDSKTIDTNQTDKTSDAGVITKNTIEKDDHSESQGQSQNQKEVDDSSQDHLEEVDQNSNDPKSNENRTENNVDNTGTEEPKEFDREPITSADPKDQKEASSENENLPSLSIKPAIASQENQYVKFKLQAQNLEEVVWDFGDSHISTDQDPEHFYNEGGNYEVTVTGRNGDREITEKLTVEVRIEGKFTQLPNIFSPNNDRNNDIFFVESEGIDEFQITIMDKEQKVVYQSNDIHFKWDGSLKTGVPAPKGDYVYMIVAKDKQGNAINKYRRLRLER